MKKVIRNGMFVILAGLCFSCSGNYNKSEKAQMGASCNVVEMESSSYSTSKIAAEEGMSRESHSITKLIKSGNLSFRHDTLEVLKTRMKNIFGKYEVSIMSENESGTESYKNWIIDLRVNSDQFDSLMSNLSKIETLESMSVSVDDVTSEYYDLESTLKTKEAIKARYLQMLSKASKISEILEIESKIGEIQLELDRTEGRLKLMKYDVAKSTIHISSYSTINAPVGKGAFDDFKEAFMAGIHGIWSFIIGLVYIWPFVLILTVVGFLVIKRIIKRRGNKNLV